jgi:hypothetical protein
VLQAAVRIAQRLREQPGANAMLNAVSGMLTKQGVSLWSSRPGPAFAALDVSAEAERATARVEVVEGFRGTARIAGYTVLYDGERPSQTVLLCDTGDGRRAVAVSGDPALAHTGVTRELCGRDLEIAADGVKLSR